ncbi:MAG TPA: hypothetical protein VEU96_21575 [Bryobacteraceae bacterium]|nr:hypothetical protein [Bryobacteraceae bacterium]
MSEDVTMQTPGFVASEPMMDVYARGIDLVNRLERECCGDNENRTAGLNAIRTILASGLERTLALNPGEATGESSGQVIGKAIGVGREVFEGLLGGVEDTGPASVIPIEGFVSFDTLFGINRLPGEPPEPGIDPGQARDFIERLIKLLTDLLEELEHANGRSVELRRQIKEWLDFFKQLLTYIAGGGTVARRYILDVLSKFTMFLYRIFAQVGRLIGRRLIFPICSLIWSFLQSIGVAFGAEAGTALAGAAGLGVIAACLIALGVGVAIGKWIGGIEIKGKTVVDWIADGMYWLVSDDCDDIYAVYIEMRNLRRTYESSGPTLDKSVMIPLLVNEAAALKRYLDKPCPDTGHAFAKELERLRKRLEVFGVTIH